MNEKALHTLEYDKIIRRLTGLAATSLGREEAEKLTPSRELEIVKRRLAATDEASRAVSLKGAPPFGGITDIRSSLQRAKLQGMLQPP